MNEEMLAELCLECFSNTPQFMERFAVGHGNYVYLVKILQNKYVIRCSTDSDAYSDTVYWLKRLSDIGIPVPAVITQGEFRGYEYLILT